MRRFARLRILPPRTRRRGAMTQGNKIVDLAEKRRELRGHLTETGELITFETLVRDRRHDDDDDPRAA